MFARDRIAAAALVAVLAFALYHATMLPGLYLFQRAFQSHRLGYASAVGLTIFLFILTLTLINQLLLKSSETESQEQGIV